MNYARRKIGGAMIILMCSAVAVIACRDIERPVQATSPSAPPVSFSLGAPDVPVQGCAKWKITLTGGTGITTSVVSTPSCGPIPPVLSSAATYDPVTKIISLPMALKNAWTREVVAPARIYAWNDSIAITTPTGLTNGTAGTYVRLVQMDSTIASGAANLANARLWKYDTLLAAHATPQILNPTATSRSRPVTMQVVSGSPTVFTVLLRVQAQNNNVVSALPPAGRPAGLYDDTNVVVNNANLGAGRVVKNTIGVLFKRSATQAQRQAAVDSVQGIIVGGYPAFNNADGVYLVRVPIDGTGTLLAAAISKLQTLSQVDFADIVDINATYNGRKPGDGSGWESNQYSYKTSDVSGSTWPLKMINAPLAWGCDTGSTTASKIAVVDEYFFSSDDINYTGTDGAIDHWVGSVPVSAFAHGTRVASIIGAIGNNTNKMTGVLWRSELKEYDAQQEDAAGAISADNYFAIVKAITRAAEEGATVINLSAGIDWLMLGHLPSDASATDKKSVSVRAKLLAKHLADLEAETPSRRPLIVLSAGNDGVDAKWNGFTSIKDASYGASATVRSRVLVVGGVAKSGTVLWSHLSQSSDWGTLIDVLAPAENIPGINGNKIVATDLGGTSFAAPFATGVAGLLSSFDARLTADSLRLLIVEGATKSARGVADGHGNTIYILDAYEALKAAGARQNSPLCGNRVWGLDNVVGALRAGDVMENLYTYSSAVGPLEHLQVAHSGHWLESNDPVSGTPPFGQRLRLTFAPTTWTPSSGTCVNCAELSGAARSGDATVFGGEVHSHDGDSSIAWTVPSRPAFTSLPVTYSLVLKVGGAVRTTLLAGMRDTVQNQTDQTFGNAPGALAYSPTGDFAVFTTYDHPAVFYWYDTKLFRIAIPGGQVTPLFTLPSQDASWISISEDGNEIAIGSTYIGACGIQYWSLKTMTKFDWPFLVGHDTTGSTTNNAGFPTCFLGGSFGASRVHSPSGASLDRVHAEPRTIPPPAPHPSRPLITSLNPRQAAQGKRSLP